MAVDLVGFRIVPREGVDRWPIVARSPLNPSWAASVAEQERHVQRSVAVATGVGRQREDA